MNNFQTHTNDGDSLFAIKEGKGEAVVFMHGFGLDHRMWRKQVEALKNNFTVINYDLRGFGESPLPEEQIPYSHEEDYLNLLKRFELDRAHIVALSMGCRMAIRCALTCPKAVLSLTLLEPAVDGQTWSAAWLEEWNNMVSTAQNHDLKKAKELWMHHSLFSKANTHPDIVEELKIMIDSYSGWHLTHKDPAIVPKPPAMQRLGQITMPTLVTVAEFEIPDFQETAHKLCSEIPLAQRLVVTGSGHMVNMESPGMVNEAILNFLSK
ncbi:MAG TPA: alpha/beta hydrolase [Puia sp.]|nr:alpha/beta hydrolase [Puia sp.]